MQFKALAIDLDGTLLVGEHIPHDNITAVRAAGLEGLKDDQKVQFELQEGRDGRSSAGSIQLI